MTPHITVVVSAFNSEAWLRECLQQLRNQTVIDLCEVVVIDGCSNDDSVSVVERYRNQLHFFASEPDRGNYDAINKGFAQTDGEIMGWLNSDDMLFPWCLRAVAEIFEQYPGVEWISSMQPALWDSMGRFAGLGSRPGFSRDAFLDGKYLLEGTRKMNIDVRTRPVGTIQQESTFWRRSLWERAGGYISSEFGPAGDFELWCRFYEHADLIGVYFPLAGFRVHSSQASSDQHGYNMQASRALSLARVRCSYHRISNRCHELARKARSVVASRSFNCYTGRTLVKAVRPDTWSVWVQSVQRFR